MKRILNLLNTGLARFGSMIICLFVDQFFKVLFEVLLGTRSYLCFEHLTSLRRAHVTNKLLTRGGEQQSD